MDDHTDWPASRKTILDDLNIIAEQIKKEPSIRMACEEVHPIVKHWEGKLFCVVCHLVVAPSRELLCECLGRFSLVFQKSGKYHAKPGPCSGQLRGLP